MPEPEHTDVIDQLQAFADDATANDRWPGLLTQARARRRRRSVATIAAAAAVVLIAAGGVAVARTAVQPRASQPAADAVDPWTDPVPGPLGVPVPRSPAYGGGVRLALLRDAKGTYAVTAGVVGTSVCGRVGGALPPGTAPILVKTWCGNSKRGLSLGYPMVVAGQQIAFVLVAPEATGLTWRQGASGVAVELHDLPGSGQKVALIAGPRLDQSTLEATVGTRLLATVRIGTPASLPPRTVLPTEADAAALFSYVTGPVHMTLWAQHESDGGVRFVGTAAGVPGLVDTFQGVPAGPDAPVREASLDRLTFGERWVCGTAGADVRSVGYRLADGRSVKATISEVPEGGRVWCAKLPHERLDEPPAKGDLIVATLRDGSRHEVVPQY